MKYDEDVLPDNYPVYWDYFYVVNGAPRRSPIKSTVAGLKRTWGVSEIRRCDIAGRIADKAS
jgi:hypothetical protein